MTELCKEARDRCLPLAGVCESNEDRALQIKTYFRDVYNLVLDVWPPIGSTDYFVTVVAKCNALLEKHKKDDLVRALLLAVVGEVENRVLWEIEQGENHE